MLNLQIRFLWQPGCYNPQEILELVFNSLFQAFGFSQDNGTSCAKFGFMTVLSHPWFQISPIIHMDYLKKLDDVQRSWDLVSQYQTSLLVLGLVAFNYFQGFVFKWDIIVTSCNLRYYPRKEYKKCSYCHNEVSRCTEFYVQMLLIKKSNIFEISK